MYNEGVYDDDDERERERDGGGWGGGGGVTCGCAFVGSTRDSMASTSAAVFSVPLSECAVKFCGGSAKSRGRARSWIFEGRLNPMAYRPLKSAGGMGGGGGGGGG